MSTLLNWLRLRAERVYGSIAFWPTVLAVAFVALAVFLRSFRARVLFEVVDETLPFLLVRDRAVSLSLLTTLVGGLISLMVFSFSMVMVLLSNATANLTPRLLPSLVGSTRHQVVLGVYLGTILYCIVIAMGFGLDTDNERPPSASLSLAVLFGIACLALFIYFIHSVSQSIQVGVVLRNAHRRTRRSLGELLERQRDSPVADYPDTADWVAVPAWRSDFVDGISEAQLAAFAKTHDTRVAIDVEPGSYVVAGEPIAYLAPGLPITGERLRDLRTGFYFGDRTDAEDYYGAGVERIVEVALKALSPGINDPGTAVVAIEYLREVFTAATGLRPVLATADEDGVTRVYHRLPAWRTLLARHLRSLQQYGSEDPMTQDALGRLRDSVLGQLRRDGRDGELAATERIFRETDVA